MIAIRPIDCTAPGVLVSTNAADAPPYASGTTYAADAQISYAGRNWLSVQSGNTGNTPGGSTLWWVDDGPVNSLACFDNSVQTATTCTGGLTFTVKAGRTTAIGLLGLIGQSVTVTVLDDIAGNILFQETKSLGTSDGTFYGFCFEELSTQKDAIWTSLQGSGTGHITVEIAGVGETACGLFVTGKQISIGKALYGFSLPIEDRGRQYLDTLGNPVIVERGYSRGCSGSVFSDAKELTKLMSFYSENISNPCLFIAAPGIADMVSASVFGKISRVVPAISDYGQITTSIEISGYR